MDLQIIIPFKVNVIIVNQKNPMMLIIYRLSRKNKNRILILKIMKLMKKILDGNALIVNFQRIFIKIHIVMSVNLNKNLVIFIQIKSFNFLGIVHVVIRIFLEKKNAINVKFFNQYFFIFP